MRFHFEEYRPAFYQDAACLMASTWKLNEYLKRPKDPELIFQFYFESSLIGSNYTDFVVDYDGRVLGYLMASIPEKASVGSVIREKLRLLKMYGRFCFHFLAGNLGQRKQVLESLALGKSLDDIVYEHEDDYDSEITLFFVSDELRGQGVGRQLMERYLQCCQAQGVKEIFLTTDLACNVGFYDHYGFKLEKAFHHPMLESPEQESNGFIYTMSL